MKHQHERHMKFQRMAMDDQENLEFLMKKLGVDTMEGLDQVKSVVLYGSETGNAQALAGVFSQELKRRGINAKPVGMDDFEFEDLEKYSQVFCVVATAGQGEFPANCHQFWKSLSDTNLASDTLKNTKFAVFGLGDTGYVYFNEAAKQIDKRLEELGAQRILPIGLGDDKDEERYETKWTDWTPELWGELGTPPPPQILLPPSYEVKIDSAIAAPDERILPPGAKLVPMVKNLRMCPDGYDRDIRHYEFDIGKNTVGYQYGVGDCLAIHPHNDPQEVEEFLHKYGLDPNSTALLEDTAGRKDPLPAVANVKKLFTEVLDLFGRPPRRFYDTLAIAAKDEGEKAQLEYLMTKEGNEKYKELVKDTVTYADLLLQYPSTRLELGYLLDHIQPIKPRLYSIASSQEMHGDNLQLCIIKDDWTTPSGRYRQGLCTRYLESKSLPGQSQDTVATKMSAAGINIPDNPRPPYVMVALGTGIAPMRAMIEDREMSRVRGETCGPMALFFGARHRASEYSYGDEFESFHANGKGVLSELHTAFSRDQAHKIYVQNRIAENPDIIYDYLVKENGFFYLCGPAGNVPAAVRKQIIAILQEKGGMSEEEADKYLVNMQIEGRYNLDVW